MNKTPKMPYEILFKRKDTDETVCHSKLDIDLARIIQKTHLPRMLRKEFVTLERSLKREVEASRKAKADPEEWERARATALATATADERTLLNEAYRFLEKEYDFVLCSI